MSMTCAADAPRKPIDLNSMADVLKLAGPQNWMLIDPFGKVWTGKDPLQLAAIATYAPPGLPRMRDD